MKRFITISLLLLLGLMAQAQTGDNWIFGLYGGLNFSSNPPTTINSSIRSSPLGQPNPSGQSACISDCNGNLLFYGNQCEIWNKNHQPMMNSNLNCSNNYTSYLDAAFAIKIPDSSNKYYYISRKYFGSGNMQLTYSIIDMSLDGGFGAIVAGKKDIIISNSLSICFEVIKHQNNKDYWLIVSDNKSKFSSFLISSSGVSTIPITSQGIGELGGIGDLCASHDGNRIVSTGILLNTTGSDKPSVILYDFNRMTGKLTFNKSLLDYVQHWAYKMRGLEFSPDNSKLYFTSIPEPINYVYPTKVTHNIYQLDFNTNKLSVIYQIPVPVGCSSLYIYSNTMRLAPNGKIYAPIGIDLCGMDSTMLIVNEPNKAGVACNIESKNIGFSIINYGLPVTISETYYIDISTSIDKGNCSGDTIKIITRGDLSLYSSYTIWFGDGDSLIVANPFASTNTDTFYHIYGEGTYTLKVGSITNECNSLKEFIKEITVKYKPEVHYKLDKDSSACWEHHFAIKDSSLLTTSTKLLWGDGKESNGLPNGTIADFYTIEDTFTYQYIATNAQCADTVAGQLISKFLPKPNVRLGVTDTAFCQDESFILTDSNMDVTGRLVNWGDGLSDGILSHTYLDTGTFEVFVTDTAVNGCYNTDSITLSATDIRFIGSSGLTFNQACEDATLSYGYTFFNADSVIIDWGDGNYDRSNNFNDLLNHIYTQGNYTLHIMTFNTQCLDTIFSKPVELLPNPVADASVAANKLCEGQSITLSNSSTGAASYKVLWGDLGEDSYPISATEFPHTYTADADVTVEVIAINAQNCPDTLKLPVSVLPLPVASFTPDVDSGCRPLDLGVNNSSSDYSSHFINWGDGSAAETGNVVSSFSHQYTDKGNYPIMLGVSNGYCADTTYGSVKVTGLSGVETSSVMVATVDGVKAVYIEWQPVNGATGYNLYRSLNGVAYSLIAEKIKTTNYFDIVSTEANSWYYKVLGIDSCGNLSLESNLGRTIFLQGQVIGKNEAAMLNWNPYEAWENGVLVYQLEVMDAFGNFNLLTSQQSLSQEDTGFFDPTHEKKCYRIVAYEQGGNNAVSTSNTVCLPYQPLLWAPNAFSPNGDGINDTWGVMHVSMEVFSFSIYNRWGEKLFESQYPTDTWDGDGAPLGVYLYIINAKGINGKPFIQKGEIHLVR